MKQPLLSVVIPVYNEEKSLEILVQRVAEVAIPKEIILVDDGSSDRTPEIIEKTLKRDYKNLKAIRHPKNRGKGAAVRTGIAAATGDMVVIQDADLEYSPSDYPRLIEPIVRGEADVVYGSRFRNVNKLLFIWHWFLNRFMRRHYEIRYLHHFVGIQALNLLANLLYGAKITDEATCYKVFRTSLLREITLVSDGFEFCPEVTAKVLKKGRRIFEVPITYHPRTKKEGKKLNWKHGFTAIWTLIKYRFVD